jgi:hypothetical protein
VPLGQPTQSAPAADARPRHPKKKAGRPRAKHAARAPAPATVQRNASPSKAASRRAHARRVLSALETRCGKAKAQPSGSAQGGSPHCKKAPVAGAGILGLGQTAAGAP